MAVEGWWRIPPPRLHGLGSGRIYLTDPADIDAVGPVHAEFFGTARPAATALVVTALLDPRWKVEIEADAVVEQR